MNGSKRTVRTENYYPRPINYANPPNIEKERTDELRKSL